MSQQKNYQMFLIASAITSVIGGILLFAEDFGGWLEGSYDYYVAITAEFARPTQVFIGLIGVISLGTTVFCLWGLTPDATVIEKHLRLLFLLNLAVAVVSALMAIALAIWWENFATDWWLDAGFYGGVIGGLLTALFIKLAIDNKRV